MASASAFFAEIFGENSFSDPGRIPIKFATKESVMEKAEMSPRRVDRPSVDKTRSLEGPTFKEA